MILDRREVRAWIEYKTPSITRLALSLSLSHSHPLSLPHFSYSCYFITALKISISLFLSFIAYGCETNDLSILEGHLPYGDNYTATLHCPTGPFTNYNSSDISIHCTVQTGVNGTQYRWLEDLYSTRYQCQYHSVSPISLHFMRSEVIDNC